MKLLVLEQGGRNIKPDLSHENSTLVPAFTRKGAMYHGTKADIIPLLMKGIEEPRNPPETSGLVVDGAVIAHQLSPARKMNVSNFRDYIQQIQLPCVETFLANKVRTYWVYDVYNEDKPSTKQAVWAKPGDGERKRVNLAAQIPTQWQPFLRCPSNNNAFFKLLSTAMAIILHQRLADTMF